MKNKTSIFKYSIFFGELNQILSLSSKVIINTINQYSFCIAEKDAEFKKALQDSDILLPDGIAIVAAVKLLTGKKIKKIAGADLHQYFLTELNKKSGKCFYLGSSENTLLKIKERVSVDFPNIVLETYSPLFKAQFSDDDNKQMIEAVNTFAPDVLFVGMTAPKQEKWATENRDLLEARYICSIGAVFDFYAGTVARPSQFWINIGLEWFIRLLKEPKRMGKRYIYYGPVFLKLILKEKIRHLMNRKAI